MKQGERDWLGEIRFDGSSAILGHTSIAEIAIILLWRSRAHDAVIRVFDEAGNVIEAHEHGWRVQRAVSGLRETKSRHAVKRDG